MTSFEQRLTFIKKPLFISSYLLALVFVFYFIDKPLALYFQHLDWRTKAPILQIFTILGQSKIYILLFLLLALFFRIIKKNPRFEARSWYLLIMMLSLVLLNFVLKIGLGRARPELFFLNQQYGFYWFKVNNLYWSFPSGHATSVAVLVFSVGLIWPRYFTPVFLMAILVMLSRIVLCNHYVSDVLFAFYFTLIMAGLLTDYIKKNKEFWNCLRSE